MRVLVACEFSGVVRQAFIRRGHDAVSCDLEPSLDGGAHYLGDVRAIMYAGHWDLMIAHPPCTHLASSGARWFKDKTEQTELALRFVQELMDAPIPRICIENPVGLISSRIRKPDQIIQPWMFGDQAQKTTCLWLKNLPKLQSTNVVDKGRFHVTKSGRKLPEWYNLPPSPDRGKLRSITFQGIAEAMAEQWGSDGRT